MSEQLSVSDMPAFRRHVRARILRELELSSGVTRTVLMRELTLSRTALTRVLEPMFTAGEIVEDPPDPNVQRGRGRPPRMLRLRIPPRLTLAVHLTHDSMLIGHVNETGEILDAVERRAGVRHGFGTCLRVIESVAADLTVTTARVIDRCVVVVPTMVHPSGTRVMPAGASELMPTWIGSSPRERIARAVGAPTWFENDGRLGALSEARFGAGRYAQTLLYVAVGSNGIGGGLVIDRKLHRGAGFAGEISHINVRENGEHCPCGRRGCVAAEVRAG